MARDKKNLRIRRRSIRSGREGLKPTRAGLAQAIAKLCTATAHHADLVSSDRLAAELLYSAFAELDVREAAVKAFVEPAELMHMYLIAARPGTQAIELLCAFVDLQQASDKVDDLLNTCDRLTAAISTAVRELDECRASLFAEII